MLFANKQISESKQSSRIRLLVYSGMIAAVYFVMTVALAPISFGPLQFRVSGLLKPLVLISPIVGLGISIGVGLANLFSPFGAWDFIPMPIVSFLAAYVAYLLRSLPVFSMIVQAAIIAIGVAIFPLYLGGGIPIWPTVIWVFGSECLLYLIGYFVLRNTVLMEDVQK